MGTLRFLFTITILLGHIYSIFKFRYHELLSSPIAFESFFLLSGFYMALVCDKDYKHLNDGYKKFLKRRFFRIFPLYWLVLVATIVLSLLSQWFLNDPLLLRSFFEHWNGLQWNVQLYILLSNLFIVGQEAIFFLKIDYLTGTFQWSQQFIDGKPPLHFFLFVSQAWAISYIIYFYFLVPFLNRLNNKWLILLLALSLSARFITYLNGGQHEPWLYRFFPFEFAFFLAGMISFRLSKIVQTKLKAIKPVSIIVFVAMIILTCSYDFWKVDYLSKQWLFYSLFFMAMPLLFSLTRKNKADNYLGELAYPLYISNFLVIKLVAATGLVYPPALIIAIIGSTILLSMLLLHFIIQPLDRYSLMYLGISKQAE